MTIRAVIGLLFFNVSLGVVGSAILTGIRPSLARRELVRLVGLAYLLGLSALMVVLTLCLVVGVPLTFISILVFFVLIFVAGVTTARYRRRKMTSAPTAAEGSRRGILTLASAVPLGALVVVLESIFRRGRLEGLLEFDGWDSWGPITKDLYFRGNLDPHFLASLPGGSYPPGLPAVLASAMHAMGSPDVVTVHLQYSFMAIGFATALLGLLSPRVRPGIFMPFVLLVFVMPDIRGRSIDMYGDLPLGYLVACVAVLIWLWLEDGEHWPLGLATLLSAGAILTKREGLLFVTCAIGAGALASWSKRRSAWPRLGISFLVSAGAWIVWAIWLSTHQLHSNGPESGLGFITDLQRAWDSVSVVANNVFDFDLWLLATTLAIAALCLALLARTYRGAVYLGSFLSLTTAAAVVVLWSTSSLTLTDASVVSRLIGTIAISAAALTPFLLQHLLDAGEITGLTSRPSPIAPRARRGTLVAGAIVVAAAGLYPATVIAKGRPRFPNSSDCVIPAGENAVVRVVFGYADSYSSALLLRDRVHGSGFRNTSVEQDGCGRLRVFGSRSVSRIDSESISRRAGAKGLTPTFELPPSN